MRDYMGRDNMKGCGLYGKKKRENLHEKGGNMKPRPKRDV
jgi:hypothetical protein